MNDIRADFQYVVSTPTLLENASRMKILCADGTYKLNIHGYPVIVVGGIDIEQKFHAIAISVTTKEESSNYEFVFKTIRQTIVKLFQTDFKPEVLISDAARAIVNGFHAVFPDVTNAKNVMCFFHAIKAMRAKVGTEWRDEVMADIYTLHHSNSEKVFRRAAELFIGKWTGKKPEFCCYFKRYWVDTNSGWYNGFASRCPSTNNGIEGYNSFLKRCVTFRELMPLGAFNDQIYRCLEKASIESAGKIFALHREINDVLLGKALLWNAQHVKMTNFVVSPSVTKCYIPSKTSIESGNMLAINDYENLQATNFDVFIEAFRTQLNQFPLFDLHLSVMA